MSVLSCGDTFTQLQLKHTPTLFTSHRQFGKRARNGCLSPWNIPQWLKILRYSCCENDKYFSSSTLRYLLLIPAGFHSYQEVPECTALRVRQGMRKFLARENWDTQKVISAPGEIPGGLEATAAADLTAIMNLLSHNSHSAVCLGHSILLFGFKPALLTLPHPSITVQPAAPVLLIVQEWQQEILQWFPVWLRGHLAMVRCSE